MKFSFRKLFRYPLSDGYMLFAFILSFFAFLIGVSLIAAVFARDQDEEDYAYQNSMQAVLQFPLTLEALPENFWERLTEGCEGIVTLTDVNATSDMNGGMQLVEVVLCGKEPFIYPVAQYFSDDSKEKKNTGKTGISAEDFLKGDQVIILGQGQKEIVKTESGVDYGVINGSDYRVLAYVGLKTSDLFDYKVVLPFTALDSLTLERLSAERTFYIRIESNQKDVDVIFQKMKKNVSEMEQQISFTSSGMYRSDSYGEEMKESATYFILYAFCLLNCIIAAEFWLWERWREVTVRRICGTSVREVFRNLYWQMVKIAGVALVICVLFQQTVGLFGGTLFGVRILPISLAELVVMAAAVLFSAAVVIVTLQHSVNRMDLVSALKAMGDE